MELHIQEFETTFQQILSSPKSVVDEQRDVWYEKGKGIVQQSNDVNVREDILTKLLFVFENRPMLMYYMGYIFKDCNKPKALMWFRLCCSFTAGKPDSIYVENALDLCKLLFEHNCISYIHLLNENKVIEAIPDARIQLLFATIYTQDHCIQLAKPMIERMLQQVEEKSIQDEVVIDNIHLIASFYYSKSNHTTAVKHLETVLQKRAHTSLRALDSRYHQVYEACLQSYILECDYLYHDCEKRFVVAQRLREFYTIEHTYTFLPRQPHERIKIAYLCGQDFHKHAVGNFLLPILQHHSPAKFDVFLLSEQKQSYAPENNNDHFYQYINIWDQTDAQCADLIHRLGIHILIDVDGYTMHNRLGILSKHPAPYQYTYLGYPNSTGLEFIQYRITDHVSNPSASNQLYSEKLVYMPRCFLLFQSQLQIHPVPFRSCHPSRIVLGSLNKETKTTPRLLRAWKTILHQSDHTVILIKCDNYAERMAHYRQVLEVSEERIEIITHCTNDEYVNLFSKIDILMDTFPYSGTTTSCNALYNSIPVVTMYHKDYHAHNVTSSILTHCSATSLISSSVDGYVKTVTSLCQNPTMIDDYKQTLGRQFAQLMNPVSFMHDYEALYLNVGV